MIHPLLRDSSPDCRDALPLHDRVQIALAIADTSLLQSLLTDCTPPIAQPHRIGSVRSSIGVPLEPQISIDGVLEFEEIYCVLAESAQFEEGVAEYTRRNGNQRGYLDLTQCEAESRTLGQGVTLAQAMAILAEAGFSPSQVDAILHLPSEAWHKSWWFTVDIEGAFTVPFLRLLRTRRYADGTFTLLYKDFFAQEPPPCFKSQSQKVLVEILKEPHQFQQILTKINYARQRSAISRALIICNQLSDLEARGYISQGISLYTADEIVLPVPADCGSCISDCPMRGRTDSPVLMCRQFCIQGF
ncbi:MAG: hypothetical protein IGS50_16425 [Synechococcales cyanobacterium C42_A2020_086]|jgi:hypothetical protein|nr:hypothetical protein [Synechococcales cyanobacterium C42_A2020_086]